MKKIPILILTIVLFLLPTVFIYGQDFNYVPLSGITNPEGKELLGGNSDLPTTFGNLYRFGIGIVFFLAFVSFLYAGWQYVGSDVITQKSDGRKRLENTAIGLLIALSGFALLNTINPDILAFQSLDLSLSKPNKNSFLDNIFRYNIIKTEATNDLANSFKLEPHGKTEYYKINNINTNIWKDRSYSYRPIPEGQSELIFSIDNGNGTKVITDKTRSEIPTILSCPHIKNGQCTLILVTTNSAVSSSIKNPKIYKTYSHTYTVHTTETKEEAEKK